MNRGGSGGNNRTGGYTGGASVGGNAGKGGFGGGGGGDDDRNNDGGGGGGYSGGAGGGGAGGGGGSIDKGTAIAAQTRSGANTGAGKVVIAVTCFATGTRIRVLRDGAPADIAVEHLAVGDIAVTAAGAHRPIRWIGSRTIDCGAHPVSHKVWPIRVAADAFGRNRPARDLYVSPKHSLCVDVVEEVLIPAEKLINGSTVAQVECDSVTYWHVELGSHDILWADGMPAESFLEMGANRALLGLASEDALADQVLADQVLADQVLADQVLADQVLADEVLARTHADFCRPFHDAGPILAIVRAQLASRAERLGWRPSREVAIACRADGRLLPAQIAEGTLFAAVPAGAALEIASDTLVPALLGEADYRRLGLAVYAITLTGADGTTRSLDLDDPALAGSFHPGERLDGLHYRWTRGTFSIPVELTAGLADPLLLRLTYEPGTIRGWTAPEPTRVRPQLRLVR